MRVYLIYSQFRSALVQMPTLEQLLPIDATTAGAEADTADYIYEPNAAELLDRLLRQLHHRPRSTAPSWKPPPASTAPE